MPALAQYVLRIAARLDGDKELNLDAAKQFDMIFQRPECPAKSISSDEGWPMGVWLPGYNLCHWNPTVESPKRDGNTTVFDFRTEINGTKSGQLYDNRERMLDEVAWFYHSVEKRWHQELVKQLMDFNGSWKGKLLCRLWFCEWRWYCGNGGY